MRQRPLPAIKPEDEAFVRSLVIYEDETLIAFNKPSGLPVQTRGNRGRCLENLLVAFARSNGKRPRLVHRIDAGTSGLLIAAKTKPAAAELSLQFARRRVRKTYIAIVRGKLPANKSGVIDQPLLKTSGTRDAPPMVASDVEGAQSAQTHWRLHARQEDMAILEVHPKTGRMHQIRAHLKHLGAPILGDPLYGAGKLSAPRLMLHAWKLQLERSREGLLRLTAGLPEDMQPSIAAAGGRASTFD